MWPGWGLKKSHCFTTKLEYDSTYYKLQRHKLGAANISKSVFIKNNVRLMKSLCACKMKTTSVVIIHLKVDIESNFLYKSMSAMCPEHIVV